ncbi:hypothetical protein BT69DRAFT_1289907, partial [Atractiella rhizophila]
EIVSKEFVQQIFAHCEKNEWDEFCTYLDPDLEGKVGVPSWARLKDGVFGNLSIAECVGNATQKNGQRYKNTRLSCSLRSIRLVLDEETGKVKEITEYMNTDHVTD